MAENTNHIISYIGDLSDVSSKIKQLEALNKKMTNSLKGDFAKASSVIKTNLNSLTKTNITKQIVDPKTKLPTGETKEISQETQKLGVILQDVNGKFQQFTNTIVKEDGVVKRNTSTIRELGLATKTAGAEQSKLAGKSSQLASNFSSQTNVVNNFSKQLKGFGQVNNLVGKSTKTVGDNLTKTSQIVKTTSGQYLKLTESVKRTANGIQTVNRRVTEAKRPTEGLGESISRLGKRALVTIPIWLGLRTAIFGTVRSFKDGVKAILDFDRALQKARRNIQATSTNVNSDFETLQKSAIELSVKTGIAVEDIVNSFQKFATVGFTTEESLAGMNASTKGAVLLFGDATTTANTFARAMRVLTDKSKGAVPPAQQIQEAIALTAELWKDNAFELDEFTASLENFSAVAKTSNLSTRETLVLLSALSTGALRGAKGGRLLRTSFGKLLGNLDKLGSTLGVNINPQLDSTFDAFLKVVGAIRELDKVNKIPVETSKAIGEIFGGIRGGQPVKALVALGGELDKIVSTVPNLNTFNSEFETTNRIVSNTSKQIGNVGLQIKRAFVDGIVGGEEFNKTLQIILKTLVDVQKGARESASGFSAIWGIVPNTIGAVGLALKDLATGNFAEIGRDLLLPVKEIQRNLDEVRKGVEEDIVLPEIDGDVEFTKLINTVKKGLNNKLDAVELSNILLKINEIGLDTKSEFVLAERLKFILEHTEIPEAEIKATLGLTQVEIKDRENVITKELERLKIQGAGTRELLESEKLLRSQLKIQDNGLTQRNKLLEIEKAINEEKRLQNELSSDSVKLFKIARDEGTDVAKSISNVLSGDTDFANFVKRGGKELEVFKKQFSSVFEQQQAKQFLLGQSVSGETGLRGGFGINIAEDIRNQRRLIDPNILLAQAKSSNPINSTNNLTQTNNTTLNITGVDIDEAKKQLTEALSNNNDDFTKKIDERIGKF